MVNSLKTDEILNKLDLIINYLKNITNILVDKNVDINNEMQINDAQALSNNNNNNNYEIRQFKA